MESAFSQAIDSHVLPGAVTVAQNREATLNFAAAWGYRATDGEGTPDPRQPMTLDTVFHIFSATKLITAVAALIAIEQGLFALDTPVGDVLPELKDIKVLVKFEDDGKPVLRAPETVLIMEHLFTHTSGFAYDSFNPKLMAWREHEGSEVGNNLPTVAGRFMYPLLFDPGRSWSYGPSLDWLGLAIGRASGGSFEEFVLKHVCKPLGIKDMVFKSASRPDMMARRAYFCTSNGQGELKHLPNPIYPDPEEDLGGIGIHAVPGEYIKVLHSLLVGDGKLLKPESREKLFTPCLGKESQEALDKLFGVEEVALMMGALLPYGVKIGHALGGMVLLEDIEGWRSEGTLIWSGLPNVYWCIDRKAGMCTGFFSQVLPPGDPKIINVARTFEKEVYARNRQKGSQGSANL